jgi:EpsI family protein
VTQRSAAIVVCAALALCAAISYAVGDRWDRLVGTVRLPQALAQAIPRELAGWKGVDDPLPDATVRTLQVDDHLRRRYVDPDGSEALLYVAFHGNKERGMRTYYHNVTVCFPSAGWRLESERPGVETLHDVAKQVPVCRYVFAKDGGRLCVMTFFKVDDDLLDQSPRNKPLWTLLDRALPKLDDSPGTFVQVQIVVPVSGDGYAAQDVQSRFLREFGANILRAVEVGVAQ